jgi:tRNA1(Val) A37 N6-methylase TrmN6
MQKTSTVKPVDGKEATALLIRAKEQNRKTSMAVTPTLEVSIEDKGYLDT